MILLALLIISFTHTWACPTSCSCKWKGGKQTVDCVNKSLITLPLGMDARTQVLDFAGNNLDRLLRERFLRMGLINLQKIFFSRCRIKHIEDRAFKGLNNLVELDLSDNLISAIPSETFYDFPSLMRLMLNGNPIKVVKSNSFASLGVLVSLELSKCEIEEIQDRAFDGMTNLEWLKLDNNKINNIVGSKILPKGLHGITLHNNEWVCDCKLLDVHRWLLQNNVPQTIEPVCHDPPRLKDLDIKLVNTDDLACLPEISPTSLYLEISEGKNISLLCKVSAIPEAKISWWFQGNVLQNDSLIAPGLHLYYYIEENVSDKTAELFIINANADDNGTYICVAENNAGTAKSNYTIRIILKEEPVVGLTVFPYEYIVIVSAGASVMAVLLIICIVLCVVQCRKQRRRRRKKDRSKVVALQSQQTNDKAPVVRENESITRVVASTQAQKTNGSVMGGTCAEMMAYQSGPGVIVVPNNLTFSSPPPPPSFAEQNPDLINDTGSKEWRVINEVEVEGDKPWPQATLQRRDIFPKHLTADVHLSPGKFIDADGYPLDYGLPKIPSHFPVMIPPTSFYRTLPHKPRQNAQTVRFSREAEFITNKSTKPAPYEHFNPTDVRYTAEGYPCTQIGPYPCFQDPFISPPAGYKGDTTPKDAAAQWPESCVDTLRTQSVAAQTTDCPLPKVPVVLPLQVVPILTESPDEGYEGETAEGNDN